MATFSERVADLVGSVSEAAALSVWLNDGVLDVTKRSIMVNPIDAELFIVETDPLTANAQSVASSKIFTVVREDGTINQWRPCRKISAAREYLVVDTGSIHLATKTNPVFFVDVNSTVNVFPAPSTTGDRFKVYYVNESPKGDGTADALAAGHTTIGYFPSDRVHLVVLYAALQELQRKMADSTLTITAVPPEVPTSPTFTLGSISSVPSLSSSQTFASYLALGPLGHNDPDTFTLLAVPPDTPVSPDISSPGITTVTVGSLGDAPTYTKPEQTYDTGQFETFLETEEDAELAQAQLGRLNHEISQYQNNIQNELNEFNEENTVYQSTVQKAIEDARMASQEAQKEGDMIFQATIQDYSLALQKYQGDVAVYGAEVQSEVQEYTQKLSRYIQELGVSAQAWQKEESDKIASFQAEVAKYSADLQLEVQKAKLEQSDEYVQELSKFQGEVQEYQVEVTAEVQESTVKSQSYQTQYTWIKQQYEQGFVPFQRPPKTVVTQ